MTYSMSEDRFYQMLDIVEGDKFNDSTEGYFPTVDELKFWDVENKLDKYKVIVAYFANDPFYGKNLGSEERDEAYRKTVMYCKSLLTEIELTE